MFLEISPEDLRLLNDFEFKQLRDFVRGKGSVSKVSVEDIINNNFQEPELDEVGAGSDSNKLVPMMPPMPQMYPANDPNVVMFGQPVKSREFDADFNIFRSRCSP